MEQVNLDITASETFQATRYNNLISRYNKPTRMQLIAFLRFDKKNQPANPEDERVQKVWQKNLRKDKENNFMLYRRFKFWSRSRFISLAKCWAEECQKGIRNLIFWIPVIWKDRDWRTEFLLRIINHKLKSMEEYVVGRASVLPNSDHMWGDMDDCREAIERILKDDYDQRVIPGEGSVLDKQLKSVSRDKREDVWDQVFWTEEGSQILHEAEEEARELNKLSRRLRHADLHYVFSSLERGCDDWDHSKLVNREDYSNPAFFVSVNTESLRSKILDRP